MNIINFISISAIPIIIVIIILYGLLERKTTYDIFIDGVKEGIEIVVKLFPTLLGIFLAIGFLRSSGLIDFIAKSVAPITNLFGIPSEIMPLALIRPISGSASTAIATDIMNNYGVDSKIGQIASTIMGSTETTLYTIAIYTSCIGIKKTKFVLPCALIGDITRNVDFCSNLALFVMKFFLTNHSLDDIMFTTFIQGSMLMFIQILLFIMFYFLIRKILIIISSKIIQKKLK